MIHLDMLGYNIYTQNIYLIDSEAGGGVGELPDKGGRQSIVERQEALLPDDAHGNLAARELGGLLGLQLHLQEGKGGKKG